MAAEMSVLGQILSAYPYVRSGIVRFPLWYQIWEQMAKLVHEITFEKK